jgi:hypothetical protein
MKKRFYETHPITAQAVELLFKFPISFQLIIGKGICIIAEREFKGLELLQSYKSLGADKVLAMYKAKRKLRHYDKEPILHEAMLYLFLLSPENQVLISKKIIHLSGYMEKYLQLCLAHKQPPILFQAEELSDTYVTMGEEEANKLLSTLESEFISQLQSQLQTETKPLLHEMVKDSEGHMKVRGDRS